MHQFECYVYKLNYSLIITWIIKLIPHKATVIIFYVIYNSFNFLVKHLVKKKNLQIQTLNNTILF